MPVIRILIQFLKYAVVAANNLSLKIYLKLLFKIYKSIQRGR